MKLKIFSIVFALIPCAVWAAGPANSGRAGVRSAPMSAVRAAPKVGDNASKKIVTAKVDATQSNTIDTAASKESTESVDCREEYRQCMDDFCLLDESEGERCACSDNIKQSKTIIQGIEKLQSEAEELYTEGVERERLGAKAKYIFGDSAQAKKVSGATQVPLRLWISGSDAESLAADEDIGDNLYEMAADACADVLAKCGSKKADMEEQLYKREIVKNCKAFDAFLAEQKTAAEQNKRTAQAAVRSAKLEVFDTTNKYNRGECLLAYRACISDKGGCGINFENCLDESLLARRANACENVLDQCVATREYVLQDWADESKMILADAAKYVERNRPLMCNAKIRNCLEEGCSITGEETANGGLGSTCLTDINVAAGVCPIIDECDKLVPGIKASWVEGLKSLKTDFCQNDVEKCMKNKCGTNFTAPECVGQSADYIASLCPKSLFPACQGITDFQRIVNSIRLNLDYQLFEGCQNYYADALGRVCGTDMKCLSASTIVAGMTDVLTTAEEIKIYREEIKEEAANVIDDFFKKFDVDKTVAACKSAEQPAKANAKSTNERMFKATKTAALLMLEQRYNSEFDLKQIELSRKASTEAARSACLNTYKPEQKPVLTGEKGETKSYTYIKSVSFEPDLRNCHVCRIQRVCETGGEKKATSALKSAVGGLSGGASVGTMASPGWGTLIGGVIGAAGGAVAGALSGGLEDYCQEIESCEDINPDSIPTEDKNQGTTINRVTPIVRAK